MKKVLDKSFQSYFDEFMIFLHRELQSQKKAFLLDDNNRKVIEFLLKYFVSSKSALDVFPDKDYQLENNILLCGSVGTGKSTIMSAMSKFTMLYYGYNHFKMISSNFLLNHYKQNNDIDFFTYNTANSKSFDGSPYHICLDDLGVGSYKHYGVNTDEVIKDFLVCRYEIFTDPFQSKRYHIITNLDVDEILNVFNDDYDRLSDRFKCFNVLSLDGGSRR